MEDFRNELKEKAQEMRRIFEQQRDEYIDGVAQMDEYLKLLDLIDELTKRCEKLEENVELWQKQAAEDRRQKAEMEMKLAEMTKLSAGMAKKASQNDMEKMLRIFLNTSKRKTMSKREAAKTVILELLNIAKIEISDDVLELLDHLDDEQPDPKVVNVGEGGQYNDIHDNGGVSLNG